MAEHKPSRWTPENDILAYCSLKDMNAAIGYVKKVTGKERGSGDLDEQIRQGLANLALYYERLFEMDKDEVRALEEAAAWRSYFDNYVEEMYTRGAGLPDELRE